MVLAGERKAMMPLLFLYGDRNQYTATFPKWSHLSWQRFFRPYQLECGMPDPHQYRSYELAKLPRPSLRVAHICVFSAVSNGTRRWIRIIRKAKR